MRRIGNPGAQKSRLAGKKLLATVAVCLMASAANAQSRTISYDEILAQPDNLQLNLDYARQEVASGRLQQAAAALERMLLQQPDWDAARLFYGVVLYRLGDLEGAIRELTVLEGRNLPPALERDRVRYLALSQKNAEPLRFSARYTLGARLDSNPGRFSDSAIDAGLAEEDADYALVAASRFRVERDLQNGRGDFLFFQTNAHINEFLETDNADLIATRAKAGATLHGVNSAFTPYALYSTHYLQHERFRSEYGGGLNTTFTLSSQVDLYLNGRAAYEDYRTTDFSTIGNARDGWHTSLTAGARWRATDSQIFTFYAHGARKNADFDGYSYDEGGLKLRSLTLFGEGVYLSLSAAYTRREYDQPDNVLSATTAREDDRIYGRAALGAPLETLFAQADFSLPEAIGDIVAQVGVSYTRQNSSIPLLDYDNVSVDILFTKTIAF